MFFGKKKGAAGLDVGSSSVKVVELNGNLNNLTLQSIGFRSLPADTIVDGQIMELNAVSDAIQTLCKEHKIKSGKFVTGVNGNSVIIKNIVLPLMSNEELEESIDWHAEEHIPFDLSEVNLDFHVTGETAENTNVLIAACKSERIENLKQAIQFAGKEPVVIDVDAFALQNCYEVNYKPEDSDVVMLLNIGASSMTVNIVQGTRSLFTRDISVGGTQFTEVLQRSLGVTSQEAEAVKRGVSEAPEAADEKSIEPFMDNVMDIVAMEIQKTFDFYRATAENGGVTVQKILISGGGSKLKGLHEELSRRLEIPVEVLDPFREIKVDSRKFDPEYLREVTPDMAVAVGLALRGVEVK